MTDHPTDDFDDRIRAAARDYNRPGETPRERMWTEIRAARARRATVPAQPIWTRRLWLIPLAAAAVLIFGIVIGRSYDRWTETPNAGQQIAGIPVPAPTPAPDITAPPDSSTHTAPDVLRSAPIAPRAPRPAPRATPRSRPFNGEAATTAYRLAVVEHLAGTEAMLMSFRAAAKRGEVDAQITAWARNLLTTTRLLEASAAQDDPTMKRLLEDLELVLVQIAQYTSAGPHHAEELELIEHSIERRGVIGKLHTNVPARLAPAGT
ncbi:MAG TPA: hypothetical protein VH539_14515 [Gemmatimonadaceae bacterium]|jgi:hypothetical protein